MLKKISVLGLLGVAALGVVALPVKADTAVVQQGTQDLIIEGDGNGVVQSSQQTSRIRQERGARSSTGVVQDVYQGGTILGDDNAVYQESSQVNVLEERQRHQNRGNRGHRNINIQQR